jgi:hypothetical protein
METSLTEKRFTWKVNEQYIQGTFVNILAEDVAQLRKQSILFCGKRKAEADVERSC